MLLPNSQLISHLLLLSSRGIEPRTVDVLESGTKILRTFLDLRQYGDEYSQSS